MQIEIGHIAAILFFIIGIQDWLSNTATAGSLALIVCGLFTLRFMTIEKELNSNKLNRSKK